MRISSIILLSFLAFLLLATSCREENITAKDELPPITLEGLNTFGCKIDGEILVPKDGFSNSLIGGGKTNSLQARLVTRDDNRYL